MCCCGKLTFHIHYWPVLTCVWFFLTFGISYAIAVGNGHAYWLFPFISDTGTTSPESCVFGIMLNLGSLFMGVTMYFRYRLVEIYKQNNSDKRYRNWNYISLHLGITACMGTCLVANFQETNQIIVHFFGALLAFGIGAVYFLIQAYMTWLSSPSSATRWFRIVLSSIFLPLYFITTIVGSMSAKKFDGDDALQWNSKHEGYALHLISTFAEWAMAIVMSVFILSYTSEFKEMKYDGIKISSRVQLRIQSSPFFITGRYRDSSDV